MPTRIITTPHQLAQWATYLKGRPLPITVGCSDGRSRTVAQNKLQRLWCGEIAEQLQDRDAETVRGHAKLTFGVPIMRENDTFRAKYDEHVKPLPYETKLALMMEPLDFPVTRLMTVSQSVRYLDAMQRFYLDQGLELTEPDPQFQADAERYRT